MLLQERYQSGGSPLHRLDVRVKLVAALLVMVGILVTPAHAWPAYPLLWALLASLAAVGGLGVWRVTRWGGAALPFALAAVTLLFTVPGTPVMTLAGITVTDAGLSRFAAIALKSWLTSQAALLLIMTTHFTDLIAALKALGMPDSLQLIIGLMYRYLTTLVDEAERLLRARAARSGTTGQRKSGGRLAWRAEVAGGMMGSLFLRSYERSERVYAAMLARGFATPVNSPKHSPLPWQDVLLSVIPIAAVVSIQILARMWWGA